ncbi:MAG: anti-sigma factor [Chloroflexi bacterium]|nr:anti-sigma factor [Chloroflexota bacterium]
MERSTDTRIYGQPAADHTSDAESLAGLYAFGALDGADLARFERHLDGCGRCAEVVDGDLEIVSALSLTAPAVEASDGFKERLLARAAEELAAEAHDDAVARVPFRGRRAETARLAWLLPLAAILLALLAGAAVLSRQIAAVQPVATVALENHATGGQANVLVRPDGEGVIQLAGFENLSDGRVYQAWVIRPNAQPVAVGSSSSGNGALVLGREVRGTRVAVTLEPGPGATVPSVRPFVIGDVPL